jgi:predicted HTH transcriptional regulator
MNSADIDVLTEEGEGVHLEFKRKVTSSEKIARTMTAFANTKGGCILFGIDDDGTIVGVTSEKEEMELLRIAGNIFAEPPVNVEMEIVPYRANRDVLVCKVQESISKPHKVLETEKNDDGTGIYIRVNDMTMEASKEVVKVLRSENSQSAPLRISIGENEKRLLDFLETHRRITKEQYCAMVNISRRRASRSLVNLVRAGILFLHTNEKSDYYTLI